MLTKNLTKNLSGTFLILFVAATAVMTCFFLPAALSKTGALTAEGLLKGTWTVAFEKKLGEILPLYEPSRNIWGRIDYALFRQGRKGVLIGDDGWLFTDEEFSCPHGYETHIAKNMLYISDVANLLKNSDTQLAIVLIPAKARVYEDRLGRNTLPPCRLGLYAQTLNALASQSIPVIDTLSAMQASARKDELYLKTDTHWSPAGARLAAETAARRLRNTGIAPAAFTNTAGETKFYHGDLTRYIPGVGAPDIIPDQLTGFSTEAPASDDLFGDSAPAITLVGTSYSANPLWNFEGFLKEFMQADILNMADEGLGPFAVMETYLANDAWKNTPPALLIWEIPERYIMMPSGHRIEK